MTVAVGMNMLAFSLQFCPAGNLAPLTRAIPAPWTALAGVHPPPGAKGQGPKAGNAISSCYVTVHKRALSFLEGCDWLPVRAAIAALEPRMIDDVGGKAEHRQHKAP
ncbi:hypothetical protein FQA47_025583 [Oryzias melastigma]|uniref:Uncharacterized protein n=1 Tax=Oryzias melastigma TaxID=30732 RepID=A0A834CRJ6_ORYME|nr:hypothetical protein FQA47_025583 [Oryzias melastigma]